MKAAGRRGAEAVGPGGRSGPRAAAPLITKIVHDSLVDGPGIRTVVFVKGCPLRCVFCHGPETQRREPEVVFFARDCGSCGLCADACPRSAIDLSVPTRILRERCDACGRCEEVCPRRALRMVGQRHSVGSLAEEILRDRSFYRTSGGGVTLSGGECCLFPAFVGELLERLSAEGIHVAIETSGHFEWSPFASEVLPHVDLLLVDLKFADPQLHKTYTGQSNGLILDNLRRLVAAGADVTVRVPLVPGITATRENLTGVSALARSLGVRRLALLPYNPLGRELAEALGRDVSQLPERFMTSEELASAAAVVGDALAAASAPAR